MDMGSFNSMIDDSELGSDQKSKLKSELGTMTDIMVEDGVYEIQIPASNLVLDVSGNSKANGAQIIAHTRHGGLNQQFRITSLGKMEMAYKIIDMNSGKVIEIQDSSRKPGARVQIWDFNEKCDTMKWRIISAPNGGYRFINVNSELALDLTDGKKASGNRIQAWTDLEKAENQRFVLKRIK